MVLQFGRLSLYADELSQAEPEWSGQLWFRRIEREAATNSYAPQTPCMSQSLHLAARPHVQNTCLWVNWMRNRVLPFAVVGVKLDSFRATVSSSFLDDGAPSITVILLSACKYIFEFQQYWSGVVKYCYEHACAATVDGGCREMLCNWCGSFGSARTRKFRYATPRCGCMYCIETYVSLNAALE